MRPEVRCRFYWGPPMVVSLIPSGAVHALAIYLF